MLNTKLVLARSHLIFTHFFCGCEFVRSDETSPLSEKDFAQYQLI
ncbi:MAG: hypothetical protein AAGE59_01625 [Cyanobacteria bacterium P01_F01_bin.86]